MFCFEITLSSGLLINIFVVLTKHPRQRKRLASSLSQSVSTRPCWVVVTMIMYLTQSQSVHVTPKLSRNSRPPTNVSMEATEVCFVCNWFCSLCSLRLMSPLSCGAFIHFGLLLNFHCDCCCSNRNA